MVRRIIVLAFGAIRLTPGASHGFTSVTANISRRLGLGWGVSGHQHRALLVGDELPAPEASA
jgi:hypothetical protein